MRVTTSPAAMIKGSHCLYNGAKGSSTTNFLNYLGLFGDTKTARRREGLGTFQFWKSFLFLIISNSNYFERRAMR